MKKAATIIIILGIGLLSYGVAMIAAIPCGPLKTYHVKSKFVPIQEHIEAADSNLQNNIPVPLYLIAQLKSDLQTLQIENMPGCYLRVAKPLACSINNLMVYADHTSQEGGNPTKETAREKYQGCMVDYYMEINALK